MLTDNVHSCHLFGHRVDTGFGHWWSLGWGISDEMKISKVKEEGRRLPWKLDGYFGGRRVRRFFRSQAEAAAELRRLTTERGETGPMADRLSPRERIVLAELRDEVSRAGGTMEEAVAFWLAHAAPPSRPLKLWDLLEDAVEVKEREGKSDRYLTQLRSSVGQLCRWKGMGERWAHEVTGDAVREWAEGNGWAGKTRRNYLIDVRTILEHGKRVGAVRRNATDGIPLPPVEAEGEVPVLSVREVARLIVRCLPNRRGRFKGREYEDLLGYVVLGCFAGLRPERELGLLTWDRIDLEEGVVIVDGRNAKSRSRRVVDLAPNAVALLKRCEGREGKVCPKNLRKRWERLREECGMLERWEPDVMRHSFASYHYARDQDEARLKAQMGHSRDSETLWKHYRRRVLRRDAERFWGMGAPRAAP